MEKTIFGYFDLATGTFKDAVIRKSRNEKGEINEDIVDVLYTPKNDQAKFAVCGFYRAAVESGLELISDKTEVSMLFQIRSDGDYNPTLLIRYLGGFVDNVRNYSAEGRINNVVVPISSEDSLYKKVIDNLRNPEAKVVAKKKKKSARLRAKADSRVDEEFEIKHNSEEE